MRDKVVGQDAALERILPYLEMYQNNLHVGGKPVGSFILAGPTGSGKTYTPEVLAENLHGNPSSLVVVNCSEFVDRYDVARFIGPPPGYIGFGSTRPIIDTQRLNAATSPGCNLSIVIFDEIEKAHHSIHNLLLQILDKGVLEVNANSVVGPAHSPAPGLVKVNFERSLVFLTSNLGSRVSKEKFNKSMGLGGSSSTLGSDESRVIREIQQYFSSEIFNRFDEVLVYKPLTTESLLLILQQQVDSYNRLLRVRLPSARRFVVEVSASAACEMLRRVDPQYGARDLQRIFHRTVHFPIGKLVGAQKPNQKFLVDFNNGGFTYE